MQSFRWLAVLLACGACAAQQAQPAHEGIVEVPAQPVAVAPVPTAAEPAPERVTWVMMPNDAGLPPLPASWMKPPATRVPYAEALRDARAMKASFGTLSAGLADGGLPDSHKFERANSLLEADSRRFAAAFYANDATATDRVDTLREGAELLLGWSRSLDEMGLTKAPANYKTDPAVALTFEDIATGPAKRWREEGLALVRLCVELATDEKVQTPSAKGCKDLEKLYARVMAPKSDAGGCACNPGDPLCSASMNGWCR